MRHGDTNYFALFTIRAIATALAGRYYSQLYHGTAHFADASTVVAINSHFIVHLIGQASNNATLFPIRVHFLILFSRSANDPVANGVTVKTLFLVTGLYAHPCYPNSMRFANAVDCYHGWVFFGGWFKCRHFENIRFWSITGRVKCL